MAGPGWTLSGCSGLGGRTDGRTIAQAEERWERETDRQPCLLATWALEATLPLATLVAECQSIVDFGRNSFYCLCS